MWFDSHCHLHLVEENSNLDEALAHARLAGVTGAVAIGIDPDSNRRARAIAHEHGLWFSAGVHPNSADEWTPDAASEIEDLMGDERAVAVGESGLDFYRDRCTPEVQRRAFRDHIALAKAHDKALVIHTRESIEAALEELESAGAPDRLIFHCWSGAADQLHRAIQIGAFVSFAGNISYRSADSLRIAARKVPPDRLLIETDAPFLAPVPHRGKPNEPAFAADVGRAVAAAIGAPADEIAAATAANARTAFGLE